MRKFMQWCVVAIAVCGAASAQAAEFFFQDGDVVVMIGDSITEVRSGLELGDEVVTSSSGIGGFPGIDPPSRPGGGGLGGGL